MHCCDISWISKFPDEEEVLFDACDNKWTIGDFDTYVFDVENEDGETVHCVQQFVDLEIY